MPHSLRSESLNNSGSGSIIQSRDAKQWLSFLVCGADVLLMLARYACDKFVAVYLDLGLHTSAGVQHFFSPLC